jgi:hypothetical protein
MNSGQRADLKGRFFAGDTDVVTTKPTEVPPPHLLFSDPTEKG